MIDKINTKWVEESGHAFASSIYALTREDLEVLFEDWIFPVYKTMIRTPAGEPKWKITNRETGQEYSDEAAFNGLRVMKLYSVD